MLLITFLIIAALVFYALYAKGDVTVYFKVPFAQVMLKANGERRSTSPSADAARTSPSRLALDENGKSPGVIPGGFV
jgi:hypothetical protein